LVENAVSNALILRQLTSALETYLLSRTPTTRRTDGRNTAAPPIFGALLWATEKIGLSYSL
jgi:hypothetical protein